MKPEKTENSVNNVLYNKISERSEQKSEDRDISTNMSLTFSPPLVSLPCYDGFSDFEVWPVAQSVSINIYNHSAKNYLSLGLI